MRRARPIKDQRLLKLLQDVSGQEIMHGIQNQAQLENFEAQFFNWISQSQRVSFRKDENFSKNFSVAMCNGITDAFHHYYLLFPERELVVLPGEYPYHRDYCASLDKPLRRYSSNELKSTDFVILSLPFSGTGNIHPQTEDLLQECSAKKIPVLLDLAFLGLGASVDIHAYLRFDCIHSLAFSFSKLFFLGRFRIGLFWSKQPAGPLFITKEWNYTNWAAATVAAKLMSQMPFDELSQKYRPLQKQLCTEYQMTPSDSVIFGLDEKLYPEFHREHTMNRLCLSKALETIMREA
ncbi:MAG: hypothetical protein K2Q26_02310 [Bdellovibrionales bacterium]|nr:hypothetical protein [Bdellovibrionales bacterium]